MSRHDKAVTVLASAFILILLGALFATRAQANPWCGPMNGPGGNFWPNVQSCIVPIPGAGAMIRVPGTQLPQNVPYQTHPATPFYPFYVP